MKFVVNEKSAFIIVAAQRDFNHKIDRVFVALNSELKNRPNNEEAKGF